ncbi:C-type lectin domain family 17, member A-like isoform X2 [Triplophysa dalaica]|uniref:C-type lectin domain family 17, member A-like isoform X2 n=1 Tax=Triplophysa dalaica TaxID=1582913 RepID=UPI0024DF7199|nr:C-type lectin domain family 17, member A-like isoform X2 [Triplophysa dalaica]
MMIKFDGKMSEISCVIYHNVAKDEIQGLDRERVELMVEFFKTADDFRTQTDSNTNKQQELQCTESSESSFHFISSERKSWTESRRFCRERGADLIIINNKEEQDFVSTMTGTENIWIGLSDIDVEGTWKWVDGSTLTLSFWKSKQPDNRIVENCAVNHLSVWSDYMCHVPFRFVCEKK